MPAPSHSFIFRVRYAETDQMGTFYHARALEWFEVGRSELSRKMGMPYTEWEKKGIFMPVIESHLRYTGRASYDDELKMTLSSEVIGHTRLRFNNEVVHHPSGKSVCKGYTVHALIDIKGRPIRIPDWVRKLFGAE